jgi:hypothetical protein
MMMHHIPIAIAGVAILFAACTAQQQTYTSPPKSRVAWAPAVSAVSNVHLNLNSTPAPADFQGPGPFQISPTSALGRAIVSKLIGWLRQARALPMAPVPIPTMGDHALSFALRDGNSVSVTQYFVPDGSANYHASPTVVLISTPLAPSNSGRYRDPNLAKWLNAGWSADLEQLAPHWTCGNKRPPSPYQNEIRGEFHSGAHWIVAADRAQGCAVLYIGKDEAWKTALIATHVFSNPWSGATVEQVQFLDDLHGLVLIRGSPYAGLIPRVLFITENGGATWHAMPDDSEQPFPYSPTSVSMHFSSPATGWLVTLDDDSGMAHVYHTISGGETWTETSFSLPAGTKTDPSRIALAPAFWDAQDGSIEGLLT